MKFTIRGEHVALDALLKATGVAPSGGAARVMIDAGEVRVDGRIETRRRCKLRPGQQVRVAGVEPIVLEAGEPGGVPERG
jgi:ribosome-associated protein